MASTAQPSCNVLVLSHLCEKWVKIGRRHVTSLSFKTLKEIFFHRRLLYVCTMMRYKNVVHVEHWSFDICVVWPSLKGLWIIYWSLFGLTKWGGRSRYIDVILDVCASQYMYISLKIFQFVNKLAVPLIYLCF